MSKKKALYPYTISPIALNMSEAEFKSAQLALFNKSSQAFGLGSIRKKEWVVLTILAIIALLGIVLIKGYSTILFWLILGLCVGYLFTRTKGLAWYARREFDKQLGDSKLPPEMHHIKLGVQPQGLVMSMPIIDERLNDLKKGQKKRGHTQHSFTLNSTPVQQAIIPWTAVTAWDDTEEFVFIMFDWQGQKGSQIIPKRLKNNHLPIDTIIKHLNDIKAKGLDLPTNFNQQ